MRQQRLAGHRMQHLRQRGAHARALAGREHDGQAGSSGHPNPCRQWRPMLRRRRHKAFSAGSGNPIRQPDSRRIQDRGAFPVNVCRVIRRGLGGAEDVAWQRIPTIWLAASRPRIPAACCPGFLAEEDDFDRRALWRLGSWGVASVGAVVVARARQPVLDRLCGATRSRPPIWRGRRSRSSRSPRKARTRRGGWPPPSIRSTAIATGCIPASPCWNRVWIR